MYISYTQYSKRLYLAHFGCSITKCDRDVVFIFSHIIWILKWIKRESIQLYLCVYHHHLTSEYLFILLRCFVSLWERRKTTRGDPNPHVTTIPIYIYIFAIYLFIKFVVALKQSCFYIFKVSKLLKYFFCRIVLNL